MKEIGFISFLIFASLFAKAQVAFKTVVGQMPLIVGEPFLVQYVLEDFDKNSEFYPPEFKNFHLVSGPFIQERSGYGTSGVKKLKNIVYTLVPEKPGKFIIPGATARTDDSYLIKSDNVLVEVISKAEALKRGLLYENRQPNNASYLRPGEDPYEKIRSNLFIKVMVDKKSCFVGEPITATFKLYSRLESKSDIVKNPGFYGFTVQDMISLNDNIVTNETINGKTFDVHTVRKVQLYPLQAGVFTIDAMEVENKVEFSKSSVNKKTEQEIIEGILPNDNGLNETTGSKVYENNMHTEPVSIIVKPAPLKNKPVDFAGATGSFFITAFVNKNEIKKNEEGELIIKISGNGNFTQLSPPAIQWPKGIEVFESQIKDSLDNHYSPLKGTRTFHFPFVSAKASQYNLPVVSFSFFDPDSNSYKTISTKAIKIAVIENEKKENKELDEKNNSVKKGYGFITGIILFVLFTIIGGWFLWTRKKKRSLNESLEIKENIPLPVNEILQPAFESVVENDKIFYTRLRECIWNFFSIRLSLSGSKMNRSHLLTALQEKGISKNNQQNVEEILEQCEARVYTDISSELDKKDMLEKVTKILEQIDLHLQ